MDGIILVDKETGWTSFDVVAKIRGLLRAHTGVKKIKVGHTGTLDPLATGLIIVVVGSYCKRAEEFSKLDKTYEVTMKLGYISTTGDEEGEKTAVDSRTVTEAEIHRAFEAFRGDIQQIPPAFSAVKVNGQRAYARARAGETFELQPRSVTIHTLDFVEYVYPFVRFTVNVSSGTYIRSLVQDIGSSLGTGAYMSNLRRTSVGQFGIGQAHTIEEIEQDVEKGYC
ncbi:hypothetical protein BH23PAT2_BH23PAT2_08920 [soil metagenome]